MNPFIKSTVARPVSQNHHDHRWSDQAADADLSRDLQPEASQPDTPRDDGISVVTPDGSVLKSGIPRRPARRLSSVLAVSGLCFGLALAGMLMPSLTQAADLNTATAQELQAVRGIGPKMARTIVDERTRGGHFASFSDLSDRVKGIGSKKSSSLQAAGLTLASDSSAKKPDTPNAAPLPAAPAKADRR